MCGRLRVQFWSIQKDCFSGSGSGSRHPKETTWTINDPESGQNTTTNSWREMALTAVAQKAEIASKDTLPTPGCHDRLASVPAATECLIDQNF